MADLGYYLGPKADIFTPVQTMLLTATGLTSSFLERARGRIAAGHWEWWPTEGTFSGPKMTGDVHRPLSDVEFRCDITCYAKTFDAAWLMAQQLGSAIRKLKFAGAKFESWKVEDSSDQASTLKTALTITVSWTLPFLEQPIGTVGVAGGQEKKTITTVNFDKTNPAYGVDDKNLIVPLG